MGEKIYRVLYWEDLKEPIVYDDEIHDEICKYTWHAKQVGYIASSSYEKHYMHRIVLEYFKINQDAPSIDHINEFKFDNRLENLRYASWSEQVSNRKSRANKKEPCSELKNIGVEEYPKFVRWDNTEKNSSLKIILH